MHPPDEKALPNIEGKNIYIQSTLPIKVESVGTEEIAST